MVFNRYVKITSFSLLVRACPVAIAFILARDGRLELLGAYSLLYSFTQLTCFLGAFGISSIWIIIYPIIAQRSKSTVLLTVVACGGPVALALGSYAVALPPDLRSSAALQTDIRVFLLVFSLANATVAFASAEALARNRLRLHLSVSAIPSIIWPAMLLASNSYNRLIDLLTVSGFIVSILCVTYIVSTMLITSPYKDTNSTRSVFSVEVLSPVILGFFGSAASQLSAYFIGVSIASLDGALSKLSGLYSIAMQIRQAILFIPAAVSNVLLKDLSDRSSDRSFAARARAAHLLLAVAISTVYLIVSGIYAEFYLPKFQINSELVQNAAIFFIPLSACIILTNNFYSRYFQASRSYWASLISDLLYALTSVVSAKIFISKFGLIGVAVALTLAAAVQHIYQLIQYRKMGG